MPVCERNKAGGQQLQLESYLGNPVPETRSALPRGATGWKQPCSKRFRKRTTRNSFPPWLARVAATREASLSPRLDAVDCNRYARLPGYSRVFDTA